MPGVNAPNVAGAPSVSDERRRHGAADVAQRPASRSARSGTSPSRSPGWQWCGEKNVLPGTQRHMLGFVKLGASRTLVACSNA